MNPADIVFWHWWILGVVLLGIEIAVLSFFLLWLALSAFIVGLILWLAPALSFELQLLLFSMLSVISIVLWQRYGTAVNRTKTDHPLLNQRGAQYVGRTFNLIAPIENGQGKIRVDDTIWKVQGEDCPVNTKVKVIAVNGTQFTVEKCE